jgi:hypothetical protein
MGIGARQLTALDGNTCCYLPGDCVVSARGQDAGQP